MRRLTFLSLLICLQLTAVAAIDTVSIYSNSMFKDLKCAVVTPTNYSSNTTRYPVVYLLHGYSGDYSNWVKQVTDMQQLADENQMLIVCPDGGYASWYFDSPISLNQRYETHIAIEVPAYVDRKYRTVASRNGRAIGGLSMGGHGAMFVAIRHADVFGACSSISGGLDISRIKKGFDIPKVLGDSTINSAYYTNWSVINLVDKFPKDSLALLIDCGTSDMFYQMNKDTHDKLVRQKIPHTYIEREGGHSWEYWKNALPYHLFFFKQYFKKYAQ